MPGKYGKVRCPFAARLTNEDFDGALDELVRFGGELTRNLLGFQPQVGFGADLSASPR